MRYNMNLIPKRIREMKNRDGLTFDQMAAKTGLHKMTFIKILEESGRHGNPKLKTLIALSKLFHCSIEDFLT